MLTMKDLSSLPVTMTVPEAGERILGLSRGSAYQAAREGSIPTVRIPARLLKLLGAEHDTEAA